VTPKRIANRLETVLGSDADPIRLATMIEDQLASYFGMPKIRAAERAEVVVDSVAREIELRAITAQGLGHIPTLIIIGSALDTVAGSCHVLPTDSDKVGLAKRFRIQQDALLKRIRGLTFSEFETFGRRVLSELGAGRSHVTPHGNDQGIDFFGNFSLGQLQELPAPFFALAHDVQLLFAGQAKHYPNSALGTNVVRELIGAVALARTKTFSKDGVDIFADLEIRPFSPVVALLFTTGQITSGAYRLAAAAGVVAKSGPQLATFLADRGVGMRQECGSSHFEAERFNAWLART